MREEAVFGPVFNGRSEAELRNCDRLFGLLVSLRMLKFEMSKSVVLPSFAAR